MKRVEFKRKVPPLRPARQYKGMNPSAPRAPAVRVADQRARVPCGDIRTLPAQPALDLPVMTYRAGANFFLAVRNKP